MLHRFWEVKYQQGFRWCWSEAEGLAEGQLETHLLCTWLYSGIFFRLDPRARSYTYIKHRLKMVEWRIGKAPDFHC